MPGFLGKGGNRKNIIGPPGLDRSLPFRNPMHRLSPSRSGEMLHLAQVSGTTFQAADQFAPGIQLIVHISGEVDVPPRGYLEGVLHSCKHAPRYCYCQGDASQQPQELSPIAQRCDVGCPGDGHQCCL